MLRDVVGSLIGVLVFATVLYAPGYLVGITTDLFGFRKVRFAQQSLWAIAFSFCVSPIAAHLLGLTLGLRGLCWIFALLAAAALPVCFRYGNLSTWSRQDRVVTLAVLTTWTAIVLVLLVDFQIGHKLYYSVVLADQSYRIAFTDAVIRTGIPPANPLYFAGSAAPMRYYYFWYILCAVVAKLGHVSARQAFIASSVWAALGLTVAIRLYATNFFSWTRKRIWIATGLLLVTGADLLPALGNLLLQSSINGNSEWWSVDQIDAWPDSVLWVPHHVAGVLCCLFAFLLLWKAVRNSEARLSLKIALVAGLACASAFGLSVYVALGFGLMMLAWLARLALKSMPQRSKWFGSAGFTAALSVFLLLPFIHELIREPNHVSASQGAVAQTHLLHFSVRPLIDSGLVTSLPPFASLNRAHPWLLDQSVRLFLLLPGMAMELGVYGLVLVFFLIPRIRRKGKDPGPALTAALYLTLAGLVVTTFLSSSVITNNDFGYRAVMLPQFFLLLLTAEVVGDWMARERTGVIVLNSFRRKLLGALVLLGAAGTIYWAVLLRAWLPITVAQASSGFGYSPDDAFQVREAFDRFDRVAPKTAVVAFRDMDLDFERKDMEVMTPTEFFQRLLVADIGRQLLNGEPKCAIHFGGDVTRCGEMVRATHTLYTSFNLPASSAREYCTRFGVQYLLTSVRDPGWNSSEGWAASLPVVASEPRLKVLACRM